MNSLFLAIWLAPAFYNLAEMKTFLLDQGRDFGSPLITSMLDMNRHNGQVRQKKRCVEQGLGGWWNLKSTLQLQYREAVPSDGYPNGVSLITLKFEGAFPWCIKNKNSLKSLQNSHLAAKSDYHFKCRALLLRAVRHFLKLSTTARTFQVLEVVESF